MLRETRNKDRDIRIKRQREREREEKIVRKREHNSIILKKCSFWSDYVKAALNKFNMISTVLETFLSSIGKRRAKLYI